MINNYRKYPTWS